MKPNHIIFFLRSFFRGLACLLLLSIAGTSPAQSAHRFAQGDGAFLLDGKPLQMISGEMHYPRVPRESWRDRMRMARAMGLNAIGTYVFWNLHEPEPGQFDFSGNNDVAAFVRAAKEEGLWVVLRPSPYVCAEWEFGGYPYWLLRDSSIRVRTRDPKFVAAYTRYIDRLARELAPLQVTHGGNILMIQVENEYGSFGQDKSYLELNRKIFRAAGFDVPLFTCDGEEQVARGYLPGLMPALNGVEDPAQVHKLINKYHGGKGPYYVAEWYPGWFDSWGKPHAHGDAASESAVLDRLLAAGISVNMYMFHGGTTRGFMNGANMGPDEPYAPETSSYDYDAPLDEAGNPTPKFFAFRRVIEKHLPRGTTLPPVPEARPAGVWPAIRPDRFAALLTGLPEPLRSAQPLSFETLGQAYGYVLYRNRLKQAATGVLRVKGLRDYAVVLVDGRPAGTLDRRSKEDSLAIGSLAAGSVLDILVENNGRINYGPYLGNNRHGILGSVTLGAGPLEDWEMYRFPFADTGQITWSETADGTGPALSAGTFTLEQPRDTYLDLRGFGKGIVFLNGHNLGKYWEIGPQQTIYVPAVWQNKGTNEIVVLDLTGGTHDRITTRDKPILDSRARNHGR